MKKTVLSLLMVAAATAAFAQGTVTFNTFNGANTALGRTYMPDGISAPGGAYLGQLWWSDTSGGTYAPIGTPQAFSTATPFYVQDGSVAFNSPFRDAGTVIFFQMRVWNASAGATWAAAGGDTPGSNPLLANYGISPIKSRTLGGTDSEFNIFTPQQFNTFANFNLTAVPEPSTVALAGLGIASLLVFRRKK